MEDDTLQALAHAQELDNEYYELVQIENECKEFCQIMEEKLWLISF